MQTITPINSLQPIYPSGNIPVVRVDNVNIKTLFKIEILRKDGESIVLQEYYEPQTGNFALIFMRDLIHRYLSNLLENIAWGGEGFAKVQEAAVAEVKIYMFISFADSLSGSAEAYQLLKSFIAVLGETASERFTQGINFFNQNLLTTQPQVREVTPSETLYLSFYTHTNAALKAKAQTASASTTITLQSLARPGQMWNAQLSWNNLMTEFSLSDEPLHFEIFVENTAGQKSFPIRLNVNHYPEASRKLFAFTNALGGIETIHFTGDEERVSQNEFLRNVIYNTIQEYETIQRILYRKKITAIETAGEKLWVADFFDSNNRYVRFEGEFVPIFIAEYELPQTDERVDEYSFSYGMRKQSAGKTPQRQTTIPYFVPD